VPDKDIKLSKKPSEPENQGNNSMNSDAITDMQKEREACRGMKGWGIGKTNGIC
jgi:hypothetical protein